MSWQNSSGLELTERLSLTSLALEESSARREVDRGTGSSSHKSAFLDPPAAEILSDPAPGLDTQRQMISRTVKYLNEVIPKLPDFFALRTTTEYEQPSLQKADT